MYEIHTSEVRWYKNNFADNKIICTGDTYKDTAREELGRAPAQATPTGRSVLRPTRPCSRLLQQNNTHYTSWHAMPYVYYRERSTVDFVGVAHEFITLLFFSSAYSLFKRLVDMCHLLRTKFNRIVKYYCWDIRTDVIGNDDDSWCFLLQRVEDEFLSTQQTLNRLIF